MDRKYNFKMFRDICLIVTCTLAALIYSYKTVGVYPFGEKTLVTSDMLDLYLPQFMEIKNLITEYGVKGLLYNWSRIDGSSVIGMGNLGVLLNPLAIIYYIFPTERYWDISTYYIGCKFIVSAITFYFMLRYIKSEIKSCTAVPLSVAWGLNTFCFGFYFIIIWTDVAILLPLGMMVLYRYFYKNDRIVIPVAYLIYLFLYNFYCAYMIVITLFLILFLETIRFECSISTKVKIIVKYVFYHVIALIVTIPILIESFKTILSNTDVTCDICFGFVKDAVYVLHSLINTSHIDYVLVSKFMIFIGVTSIIAILLILFNSHDKARYSDLILIILLLLSFIFEPLYTVWQAFDKPTGFPGRMGYIFIFLVFKYIAVYLDDINKDELGDKTLVLAVVVFVYLIISIFLNENIILISILPALISLVTFVIFPKLFKVLIPIFICLEVICADVTLIRSFSENLGFCKSENIVKDYKTIQHHVDSIKYVESEENLRLPYRVELVSQSNLFLNFSQIFGIQSVYGFDNICNRDFIDTFSKLNSTVSTDNTIAIGSLNEFTKYLMGVKYSICSAKTNVENPYPSIGFMVKDIVTSSDINDPSEYITNTNRVISKLTGLDEHVLMPVQDTTPQSVEYTFEQNSNDSYYLVTRLEKSERVFINRNMVWNGVEHDIIHRGVNKLPSKAGSTTLKMESFKGDKNNQVYLQKDGLQIVRFDLDKWNLHKQVLESNKIHNVDFDGNSIRGTVQVDEDRPFLLLSLPSNSYKIYCDNIEQEKIEPLPGFLGCKLTAGNHFIEVVPEGLIFQFW